MHNNFNYMNNYINPFFSFNSIFTPSYNFPPTFMQPQIANMFNLPGSINYSNTLNFPSMQFSSTSLSKSSNTDNTKCKSSNEKSNENTDRIAKTSQTSESTSTSFDNMLSFVLSKEGGYNPNDCGQAGNKGILQSTYDSYRKKKGLSTNNVKNITNSEVRDIYYTMYYKESGADKIADPRLALMVFDTAVNMGVSVAKKFLTQSDNNYQTYKELRIQKYRAIAAKNKKKAKFLNVWLARVSDLDKYVGNNFSSFA